MEQNKRESEKMVSFKDTSVSVAEANPILESKGTALFQGDKMFKVFFDLKLIWRIFKI
jgi:tRNA uridine 5-carboxymethylaminomethyl modification enzyme